MRQVISISDCKVSAKGDDLLVTHGLGSCIGVAAYDRHSRVGGMLHYLLPQGQDKREQPGFNPYMYGDTGLDAFFRQLIAMGARKENLRIVVAGGASINTEEGKDLFAIGKRNAAIVKKYLWVNNLLIDAESVGGTISRTLYLEMENGKTYFTSQGVRTEL